LNAVVDGLAADDKVVAVDLDLSPNDRSRLLRETANVGQLAGLLDL
jgi:hypothetical protein